MADLHHPAVADLELPDILFALSDPARLAIVRQLAHQQVESTCHSVALDMPKSTRSHHLRVLREAGIVFTLARGREKVLTLRLADLESRWPGLLPAVIAEQKVLQH